jgi:hypothetical protein
MKYTHRSFKRAGFFTLALVLTLVSLSACGKNADNPFMDKILGDSVAVPEGVFFTSQVGKYPNNMHELAPYINAKRESHDQYNPIPATFLGNDFNEIKKVFVGENGVVEEISYLSLDMSMMEGMKDNLVPADCFNGELFPEVKIVEAWLPETVETLEERSFANNGYLNIISMTGVKSIKGEAGKFAFYKTNSLEEFYLPGNPPVGEGVFGLVPSEPVLHVPEGTDIRDSYSEDGYRSPYIGWAVNKELLTDNVKSTFKLPDSEG